jgi:hypothetical protein
MQSHGMLTTPSCLQGVMTTFWVGDGDNSEDNTESKIGCGHADGNRHSIDKVESSEATVCGILSDLDGPKGGDVKEHWMTSDVLYTERDMRLAIDGKLP